MPDIFDENGLQIKTLTELREELVSSLQTIYGVDINVEQNSPDGQQINIFAQSGVDLREVLQKINASFDPEQAEGRVLDQRVGINGIKRKSGSFTLQDIEIITDRSLNLVGLDSQATELEPTIENLYTVKDDEGNEFYLLSSISIVGASTNSLTFRAAEIGQVEVLLNTITNPVIVIAGVTSINNPTSPNSIGIDEESDFTLKQRRSVSVALLSTGYLDAIEAALLNLDNVTTAIVRENDTSIVDGDGTNPHTIWAIVEGGDPDEIGSTLYSKKSSGSGMRGAQLVNVPRPDGRLYEAKYDLAANQDLYIRFNLTFSGTVDTDEIKRLIVENVIWEIGKDATADTVTCYVKSINSDYVISGMEISDDNATWLEVVSVASPQNRFKNDITRITIT